MMRIILLISIFTLLYSCSSDKVNYLPQVVYLKAPEKVDHDGEKLLLEFAVSDIKSRTGDVIITLNNNKYELKDKVFSSTGNVITTYIDDIPSSKFSLKFELKANKSKSSVEFEDLEVNNKTSSDEFDVEAIFLSANKENKLEKTTNALLRFVDSDEPLIPNDEGKILLEGISSNRYDFDVEGRKKDSDGFYRYIFLDSIVLNKETKLYFNIVYDENEYYDEPLLDCSYSSSKNNSFLYFFFLLFFALRIYKGKISN